MIVIIRSEDGLVLEGKLPYGRALFLASGDYEGVRLTDSPSAGDLAHVMFVRSGRRLFAVALSKAASVGNKCAQRLGRGGEIFVGIRKMSLDFRLSRSEVFLRAVMTIGAMLALAFAFNLVRAVKGSVSSPAETNELECAQLNSILESAVADAGEKDLGIARAKVESILARSPRHARALLLKERIERDLAKEDLLEAELARVASAISKADAKLKLGNPREAFIMALEAKKTMPENALRTALGDEIALLLERAKAAYISSISPQIEGARSLMSNRGKISRNLAAVSLIRLVTDMKDHCALLSDDLNLCSLCEGLDRAASDASQKWLSAAASKRSLRGCKMASSELEEISIQLAKAFPQMAAQAKAVALACRESNDLN